jgi:hypothetical protein
MSPSHLQQEPVTSLLMMMTGSQQLFYLKQILATRPSHPQSRPNCRSVTCRNNQWRFPVNCSDCQGRFPVTRSHGQQCRPVTCSCWREYKNWTCLFFTLDDCIRRCHQGDVVGTSTIIASGNWNIAIHFSPHYMLATSHHITFHPQMVADDTAARKLLKKIAKQTQFSNSLPREIHYLFFLTQMQINLQCRIWCLLAAGWLGLLSLKERKKVVVPRKKKKNAPGHALPMFNDTFLSPVLPNNFARQSTNLVGVALAPLEIVKRSKWLHFYPDPWDPARLALVKEASNINYWYAFLYNTYLDEKLSRWCDGSSNVLSFLVKSDILRLMKVGIDLVPLMTYKFVFICVPCLWKTHLEKDRLQVLVDAIERNPHLVPKAHRFLYLLFSSRCKNPLCIVQENTFNSETGKKLVVDKRTPFNSLHFFGIQVSAWTMPKMFGKASFKVSSC